MMVNNPLMKIPKPGGFWRVQSLILRDTSLKINIFNMEPKNHPYVQSGLNSHELSI